MALCRGRQLNRHKQTFSTCFLYILFWRENSGSIFPPPWCPRLYASESIWCLQDIEDLGTTQVRKFLAWQFFVTFLGWLSDPYIAPPTGESNGHGLNHLVGVLRVFFWGENGGTVVVGESSCSEGLESWQRNIDLFEISFVSTYLIVDFAACHVSQH